MGSEEIVLVVDDDEAVASTLRKLIESFTGEKVVCAANGAEAEKLIHDKDLLLAILDYRLPDISGIELLKLIKSIDSEVPVIIATGFGTIESGVEAIKEGAHDYILKPILPEKLKVMVTNLIAYRKLKEENIVLREELGIRYSMGRLIGKSEKIRKIYDLLPDLTQTDSTVLIQGESGTGKELLARAIHHNSSRKDRPFVIADCTVLAEGLLESELFGHEKGAFTGAIRTKIGRFEQADKGTIFLDEVADFSPMAQLKLLRVLQERKFERVGGEETKEVDVRVIAATNKNLEELVEKGRFREDLYYRLNVIPIFMPSLRERKEDIPMLAREFLDQFSRKSKKRIKDIDNDAYRALIDYDWPGNIRELENTMERAAVVAKGNMIKMADLPPRIQKVSEAIPPKSNALGEHEKNLIIKVLLECNNNIYRAARELGISRSTLYNKMKKFGIKNRTV